jgi:glyoxylase-like metal-dependent hydrolase (beta-lactamase superfamily II)
MTSLPADLVRLCELDAAWATRGSGARLDAIRRAGRKLRDRILATGTARCVRTADVATFPYPTRYALEGAAGTLAPYVLLRNRMHLVQVQAGGRVISILVNPTDARRSAAAPYFTRLERKYGALARKLLGAFHSTVEQALAGWRVAPEQIDYVTFDHLHVQDVRGLLAPGPDGRAYLPNAKLLAQRAELDTLTRLHPLQAEWYIPACLTGVPADRIVALDGDYAIGGGFAIVRTPGHTWGNHTLVVVTDRGAWTISENGVCVDAYAPGISEIRGIARHARDTGVEVILNANTREGTLDQYTSMVLEKTLADTVPDRPELPQHFSSSELVPHVLAPGVRPTYSHGAISHGEVVAGGTPEDDRRAHLASAPPVG